MKAKILIIEDDDLQRGMIAGLLERRLGYSTIQAADGQEGLNLLRKHYPDGMVHLVLTDISMPNMTGLEILEVIKQEYPRLPVIVLTSSTDIDIVVSAMKHGAYDYLNKPLDPRRMEVSIQNALRMGNLEREFFRLKCLEEGRFSFDHIIGSKSGLRSIVAIGRKAAYSDIPVLLTGETGAGKEIFARALHGESRRADKPFVAVNCGAIPEQLVESTLFGHEKGAFTGAVTKALGKFQEAEGGTLFLDEIGELPPDAQVKFLRALQSKEICPVGSTSSLRANVRIVAATNRDLPELVAAGMFREDLFYRINVLQIRIPSLQEHACDIPDLVHHFLERIAAKESRAVQDISSEAISLLLNRRWAGNIRELENTIYRAAVMSENHLIDVDDLAFMTQPESAAGSNPALTPLNHLCLTDGQGRLRPLEELERAVIAFSLMYNKNNIVQAADALKVSRSTFYRKLKDIGEKAE
jgi:DNA-binding NtrC family response regulator